MIRAKISIQRTPEGFWKLERSAIHIDSAGQLALPPLLQEESLDDLVETLMGQTLLSLDKNGRRGTSEPIQWEIMVDRVPHCYRCVQPMLETTSSSDGPSIPDRAEWKCAECGTVTELR